MSNPQTLVPVQLPKHFTDFYPQFILFLQKYYEYVYREKGYSKAEIDNLLSDQSWYTANLDQFVQTGNLRYFGPNQYSTIQDAIVEMAAEMSPGASAERVAASYNLDRQFDWFETADGDDFTTSDGNLLDAPYVNETFVNGWYQMFGFLPLGIRNGIDSSDPISFIKVLKHIYNIKGTKKAINLFFSLFYGEEPVQIYLPKVDIAIPDDNFIPDGVDSLRDDNYYNEYSYVIRVANPVANYSLYFDSIYKRYLHPAGFSVFLEQVNPDDYLPYPVGTLVTENGTLIVDEANANNLQSDGDAPFSVDGGVLTMDDEYEVTLDNNFRVQI